MHPAIEPDDPVDVRPYGECDLERETFWLHLTEAQATAIAGGYVPNGTKSVLRELLDYRLEDERRADRPMLKASKKKASEASAGGPRETGAKGQEKDERAV